jgi:hypothetical protein
MITPVRRPQCGRADCRGWDSNPRLVDSHGRSANGRVALSDPWPGWIRSGAPWLRAESGRWPAAGLLRTVCAERPPGVRLATLFAGRFSLWERIRTIGSPASSESEVGKLCAGHTMPATAVHTSCARRADSDSGSRTCAAEPDRREGFFPFTRASGLFRREREG